MTQFTLKVTTGLDAVDPVSWDACAHGEHAAALGVDRQCPFVSHAFLQALEGSGCVGPGTGWSPAHLLVEDEGGALCAAAPAYLKTHSQGEYVFDHGWADAYARAGGQYYPKLQVSVPFTPATGPRLLVRPGPQAQAAQAHLVEGLRALRARAGASSIHVTFLPKAQWEALGEDGFLKRINQQFHWMDEGYGSFEGFLESLASRKRKTLRRERRDALAAGITIEWLRGHEITQAHWDDFYAFYRHTGAQKWGRPYLNREVFSRLGEALGDRVLLILAKRSGRYIAGAINFVGATTLYGRNWGCIEEHPFLHFEVCYYQAIDFALVNGLSRVEAGAQGEHKLLRGYRPVETYSAHEIADPRLRRAVADYLGRERAHVEAVGEELQAALPFRRGG